MNKRLLFKCLKEAKNTIYSLNSDERKGDDLKNEKRQVLEEYRHYRQIIKNKKFSAFDDDEFNDIFDNFLKYSKNFKLAYYGDIKEKDLIF